jgi:hypothetical protein
MRPVVNGINIQRDPGRRSTAVHSIPRRAAVMSRAGSLSPRTSIGSASFGQRVLLSAVLGNPARHHGQIC